MAVVGDVMLQPERVCDKPTLLEYASRKGYCQVRAVHALIHLSAVFGLFVGKHVSNCLILLFSLQSHHLLNPFQVIVHERSPDHPSRGWFP